MNKFLLQIGLIQSSKVSNYSLASIDSRNIVVGQIFFALPGLNTSGKNFVMSAAAKGAAAAVVTEVIPNCPIPQVIVSDTMQCLFDYAMEWRTTLEPYCFGVTGSNGKTTVRAMIQHVLETLNYQVCASNANNNNDLGVSLSVLKLRDMHSHAVFELGARGKSQIKRLASLVKPNIGIITNISECHLDGFGSLDDVVKAKSELFTTMDAGGTAIVNTDSYGSRSCIADSEHLNVVTYGSELDSVDFAFDKVTHLHNGGTRFSLYHRGCKLLVDLSVSGDHNVYNALAAIAALTSANLDLNQVVQAISSFKGVDRRLMAHTTHSGLFVIDDSYNASPASFRQALACLGRHFSKNKWIVCGDMAELGAVSEQMHKNLISEIKSYNFSNVILFGEKIHAAGKASNMRKVYYAKTLDEIKSLVVDNAQPGDVILVKGSRFMHLDVLVDYLLKEPARESV